MRAQPVLVSDRGATVPEYALIVALVVVGLIAGLGFLQDRSTQKLGDEDARIGVIEDQAAYATPVGPGGPPVTDPPPPAGSTLSAPQFSAPNASNAASNKWNAFITITVVDSLSQPVSGVVIGFRWTSGGNPSGSCTTNGSGQCSLSQVVNDNSPSVSIEIDEMTKEGWIPPTLPVASGPIDCSPPLNSACN